MDKTFFTRSISRRRGTRVCATLREGRVVIDKSWLAESREEKDVAFTRRQARREADTMCRLAVRRDGDGRVVSNNNFIFSCRVMEEEDRTILRMDTEAGWTAAEYRVRWREGRRAAEADSLPPDDFPQDTMPWPAYLARVLDIVEETAYALRCIHSARPVCLHCDIKPANLWVQAGQHPLERMGGVRLIDFGSAFTPQELDSARTPQALLDGFRHVCGTPGFWSPAVQDAYLRLCDLHNALSGHTPDVQDRADNCRRALQALGPADDIYSLTATFLWLLTGQVLQGQDEAAIRGAVKAAMAPLPDTLQRATADCILSLLRLCAGAEPPADCDDRMIRELETLRDIAGCTGLHPETLRQCARQWWTVWSRVHPIPPRIFLEEDALPLLSGNGAVLDPRELAWCKPERTYRLADLLERGKHKNYSLVGPAGIGKTCLLRHTFCQLLEAPAAVPLYLSLDQLDPTVPDALLRFLGEQYLSRLQADLRDSPAALRRLFATETRCRFVLLLDHLDPAQCEKTAPLALQIRELCAFDSVKVITAGREEPSLGLPVLYAVPRGGRCPGGADSLKQGNWYQRLARYRLCQTILPYTQYRIFMSLDRNSRQTVTAAQMNVLWLYHLLHTCTDGTDPTLAQTAVREFFPALCAELFRRDLVCFTAESCRTCLPARFGAAEPYLAVLLQMGLLTRRQDSCAIDEVTRDLGAALYYAGGGTVEQSRMAELRDCLCHGQTDPEGLLFFLAELSPRHPLPETANGQELSGEAQGFLAGLLPRHSLLDGLLDLCCPEQERCWQPDRYAVPARIFRAWVYERGGDLSGCDLRPLDPDLLDLCQTRLLGNAGPALLPEHLRPSAVTVLPLPAPLCWMDWRGDCLLLAGEREAVVLTAQDRMFRLPLAEECRRIVCGALCPETGRIEIFAQVPKGYRYLIFDLATGASLPAGDICFPDERMDSLCRLRSKEEGWLTSDRQYRLAFWKSAGRTYLVAVPRFSPARNGLTPQGTVPLWEVAPCELSADVPLAYGELRMECGADRVALYDIRQGKTLWTEPRSRLWKMVRQATKEILPHIRSGVFALLPDGFVFEIQYGLGLSVQAPGCFQWYWLVFCDRHGIPQHYARYNMNHYNLVEADRWPRDISQEEKQAFLEQERSPAAPLNHRVYANGKLYLRSDLKPYLLVICNLETGKVERLVNASMQVVALVREEDRVVAVCVGGKKGFLLSGTVEEIRRTVPLGELLRSYRRYTPYRQTFVPFTALPVTAQQVQAFAPPARPDDALQAETFLQDHLVTETVVV